MSTAKYRIPIGTHYNKEIEFAEDRGDIRIGVWIFMKSINSRYYPPKPNANCIYEGYFIPFCIVNETRAHWHACRFPDNYERSPKNAAVEKIHKTNMSSKGHSAVESCFYTLNEYFDDCWLNYNRIPVEKALRECVDNDALVKVLECLEGTKIFDFEKYLKTEKRRQGSSQQNLGEAILEAIRPHSWFGDNISQTIIMRNIANAIGYEEIVEKEDLKLWQEGRSQRSLY